MPRKKPAPIHTAEDFGLHPLENENDMFRWFLLTLLLCKPIQSTIAIKTWHVFMDNNLDTPWSIAATSDEQLVSYLHAGSYTRYQHVMAKSLHICMQQLINSYDGSIYYLLDICQNEDDLLKELQKLHGVGPKTAELFMRETPELFARRAE